MGASPFRFGRFPTGSFLDPNAIRQSPFGVAARGAPSPSPNRGRAGTIPPRPRVSPSDVAALRALSGSGRRVGRVSPTANVPTLTRGEARQLVPGGGPSNFQARAALRGLSSPASRELATRGRGELDRRQQVAQEERRLAQVREFTREQAELDRASREEIAFTRASAGERTELTRGAEERETLETKSRLLSTDLKTKADAEVNLQRRLQELEENANNTEAQRELVRMGVEAENDIKLLQEEARLAREAGDAEAAAEAEQAARENAIEFFKAMTRNLGEDESLEDRLNQFGPGFAVNLIEATGLPAPQPAARNIAGGTPPSQPTATEAGEGAPMFSSVEAANAANLPAGTQIVIRDEQGNLRPAIIE